MQVNSSIFMRSNSILPSNAINRSIQNKLGNKNVEKDNATISPQGKMMQMIEQLQKQKENIIQRKNEFMNKAEESGLDSETIKAMQDVYEQQIEQIDEQISQIYAQETEDILEQEKKEDAGIYSKKDLTKEEQNIQKIQNISEIDNDISQAEKVHSIQEKTENQINIEEGNINTSELRIDNLESKKLIDNNINVEDAIKNEQTIINNKLDNIKGLKKDVLSLEKIHGDIMGQINEESEELKVEVPRSWTIELETLSSRIENIQTSLEEANSKNLSFGERLSFLNDKTKEWVNDIKENDPEMFLQWLKMSRDEIENGVPEQVGLPQDFDMEDYNSYINNL